MEHLGTTAVFRWVHVSDRAAPPWSFDPWATEIPHLNRKEDPQV